jgi:hypothetical protein
LCPMPVCASLSHPAAEPQIDVLEPATLLLRRMPRFRWESGMDVTGKVYDDLPEFLHYRYWLRVMKKALPLQEKYRTIQEPVPPL